MTDPLEDILKHIKKHTPMNHTYTHKEQFKNTQNGTHTRDTQQESMMTNPRDNRRVNNGQKDSVNSVLITCNRNVEKPIQESVGHTRTRYGRII